jgi:hypothetical protein
MVMQSTIINGRWQLMLPEHRAARPEWPVWEKERLAAMHDTIKPGDLVFDCGAEEGDFPALWASWGADVVMIEPNPRVWPNIRAIFHENELEHRVRDWFVGLPERPDCPITTLDVLGAHCGAECGKTVITIDVEGAELTVLRGARAMLQKVRPVVFVSVHIDMPWIDEKYPGDTGDKVAEYMESFGYKGQHLITDHEEHWVWWP